jgi:hypothetical protein
MSKITESDLNKVQEAVAPFGFVVLNASADANSKFIVLKKLVNAWGGIDSSNMPQYIKKIKSSSDFFTKDKVYRIKTNGSGYTYKTADDSFSGYNHHLSLECIKETFQPSTEEEFVDCLKAEVFRRYPNLQVGDNFKAEWLHSENDVTCKTVSPDQWTYHKDSDKLFLGAVGQGGAPVYCEGRFAERVSSKKYEDLTNNQKEILEALEHFFGSPLKEITGIVVRY